MPFIEIGSSQLEREIKSLCVEFVEFDMANGYSNRHIMEAAEYGPVFKGEACVEG